MSLSLALCIIAVRSNPTLPLGRLVNSNCKNMTRHLTVCSTTKYLTCSLYCNYGEWKSITVSGNSSFSGVINSVNKASTLITSVTTCIFLLAQQPNRFIYPVSIARLESTLAMVFSYFTKVQHAMFACSVWYVLLLTDRIWT